MNHDSVVAVHFGRYAVRLAFAVSDAKVVTGRHKPSSHLDVLKTGLLDHLELSDAA